MSDYDVTKPFYGFAASPVIEGDLIVLTVNNSGLALDKQTGEMVWISDKPTADLSRSTTGAHYSTPVMYEYDGKRYTLISSIEGLHSVQVASGEVLWTYPWDLAERPAHATEPIVFENKVFITRYDDEGCVLLDIAEGTPKVLWKNGNMSSDISSPVLVDGYIYGCDGGPEGGFGTLRCLDASTGEVMWEEGSWTKPFLKRMTTAAMISAAGKLIILEYDGTLRIVEATPSAYTEVSSCEISGFKNSWWAPPALCNGKVYCRCGSGELVCIDVSK